MFYFFKVILIRIKFYLAFSCPLSGFLPVFRFLVVLFMIVDADF